MATSSGSSGIFSFPFRVLAASELPQLDGASRGLRYRLHKPFLVRANGSPLIPSVPISMWPDFQWHKNLPIPKRLEAPQNFAVRLNTPFLYDGLRIDCWGKDSEERLDLFVEQFLRWLRRLCGQPWLGEVDRFFERTLKHQYSIDDYGHATETPYSLGKAIIVNGVKEVTEEMWRTAFQRVVHGDLLSSYWNTFYEGLNAKARGDYPGMVMTLAMGLEGARDVNLSRLVPHKYVEGVGYKLDAPFAHTNLLDHLTRNLSEVIGRDFSTEYPKEWVHLKNLYVVRHHVAHGKGAVFWESGKLIKITEENTKEWPDVVRAAMEWLESIKSRAANP